MDMRVIKFRAFNKGNGNMIDLYKTTPLALDANLNCDGLFIPFMEDFILMQFTGLLDKNGKEIYEGDILRESAKDDWDKQNYACYEIFFHGGDANSEYNIGYSMNRSHYHGSVCGGYIPSFKPKTTSKMDIIGNIFENPELISQP